MCFRSLRNSAWMRSIKTPSSCRRSARTGLRELGCSVSSSCSTMPFACASSPTSALLGPRMASALSRRFTPAPSRRSRSFEVLGLGTAHAHHGGAVGGELRDGTLGEQLTLADDEHAVDRLLDLGPHMARHQHGAAIRERMPAGSRAGAASCHEDRGRWPARRAEAPRGRRAARRPGRDAASCRWSSP